MPAASTDVSVYVLALGGKFLGSKVGFAQVTITVGTKSVSGTANMGYPAGQDGSGIVGLIMGQPLPWGTLPRTDDAASFTTKLSLSKPTLATVTATTCDGVSVSSQQWIVPGQNRTGPNAIVLIVPGLRVAVPSYAATKPFVATVEMMCGCVIDNVFWPEGNFSVVARLRGGGTLPLAYTGPSTFSATVPAKEKVIGVIATEAINGNTGVSFA